jgi:hypothetical protein
VSKHLATGERILGRLSDGRGPVEELQIVAGSNVTVSYDADAGTITITANGSLSEDAIELADGTSITLNSDYRNNWQENSQAAGTLTINAPVCSPTAGDFRSLLLRLKLDNTQTIDWDDEFRGSTDLPLPATLDGGFTHYMRFRWNDLESLWDLTKLITEFDTPAPPGAHRYWRINGITLGAGGNFLEISELQVLEASVNVTSSATKTASTNPDVAGALADIYDGNLSTRNIWNQATVEAGGFYLHFDFGAGGERAINGVKQGGYDTNNRYMAAFTLQHSDDNAAWTTLGSKSGLSYPGNNTLSSEYTFP